MDATKGEVLTWKIVDDVIIFSASRGTIKDARAITRELDGLGHYIRSHPACKVVLDLGKLEYFSSIAMGILVGLLKKAKAVDGAIKLCSLQKPIIEIFEILRLTKIFDICPGVPEAIASFKTQAGPELTR